MSSLKDIDGIRIDKKENPKKLTIEYPHPEQNKVSGSGKPIVRDVWIEITDDFSIIFDGIEEVKLPTFKMRKITMLRDKKKVWVLSEDGCDAIEINYFILKDVFEIFDSIDSDNQSESITQHDLPKDSSVFKDTIFCITRIPDMGMDELFLCINRTYGGDLCFSKKEYSILEDMNIYESMEGIYEIDSEKDISIKVVNIFKKFITMGLMYDENFEERCRKNEYYT